MSPVIVTRDVMVVGAPFGPTVGIVVVRVSVIGAVTRVEIVVVAVTISVESSAIEEASEVVGSAAFGMPDDAVDGKDDEEAAGTVVVAVEEGDVDEDCDVVKDVVEVVRGTEEEDAGVVIEEDSEVTKDVDEKVGVLTTVDDEEDEPLLEVELPPDPVVPVADVDPPVPPPPPDVEAPP